MCIYKCVRIRLLLPNWFRFYILKIVYLGSKHWFFWSNFWPHHLNVLTDFDDFNVFKFDKDLFIAIRSIFKKFFFACVSEFFDFKDHKTRFLHGNLDFSKIVFSKYCLHIYCVSNLFQFPVTSSYNSAIGKIAPSYYIYIYLF